MPLCNKREKKNPLLLDSAMGTQLLEEPLPPQVKTNLALANSLCPAKVIQIHRRNIQAGSHFIRTHSFTCNPLSLKEKGISEAEFKRLLTSSVENARQATTPDTAIVGSIGPMTQYLRSPHSRDTRIKSYQKIADLFTRWGVEILLLETFSDLAELETALRGIRAGGHANTKVWVCFFQVDDLILNKDKFHGMTVAYSVSKWGFNCCPIERIKEWRNLDFATSPSLFLPNPAPGRETQTEEALAKTLLATCHAPSEDILGGCCGSTHTLIAALRQPTPQD